MGVLPVPPVAKLPTQIIGKLKEDDLKIFLLYNQLRSQMIAPYIHEIGKRRYRKLFSKRKVV
jgi:hypothetical protein